jgi:hypothetical protein
MSSDFTAPITIASVDLPHWLERVRANFKIQRNFWRQKGRLNIILA